MNDKKRDPNVFREVTKEMRRNYRVSRKQMIRAFAIYGSIFFFSLIFLGIGYWMVVVALGMAVRYFYRYWTPAYRSFAWLVDTPDPLAQFPMQIEPYRWPVLVLEATATVYVFYFGIQLLFTHSFLDLNLIYWLINN